jgi:hypothetical protein
MHTVAWWLGTRETVRYINNVRYVFEGNANDIINTKKEGILKY